MVAGEAGQMLAIQSNPRTLGESVDRQIDQPSKTSYIVLWIY
jgi:hypothetical protein